MSGPNVRLSDPLRGEAVAFARSIGISLSALVAVSVRDYLDARQRPVEQPAGAGGLSLAPASHSPAPRPVSLAKVGRNDPCPCGSGKKYKQCHGGAA